MPQHLTPFDSKLHHFYLEFTVKDIDGIDALIGLDFFRQCLVTVNFLEKFEVSKKAKFEV